MRAEMALPAPGLGGQAVSGHSAGAGTPCVQPPVRSCCLALAMTGEFGAPGDHALDRDAVKPLDTARYRSRGHGDVRKPEPLHQRPALGVGLDPRRKRSVALDPARLGAQAAAVTSQRLTQWHQCAMTMSSVAVNRTRSSLFGSLESAPRLRITAGAGRR